MSDELREIVEAAELAYREYSLGKPPDDQMLEARERFEEAFNPERVSKMLDVVRGFRLMQEEGYFDGGVVSVPKDIWLDTSRALAALDASSSVTEGRQVT